VHCTLGESTKNPGAMHFWYFDIQAFWWIPVLPSIPQVQRTFAFFPNLTMKGNKSI
jgi:hypothetical protein